MSIRRERRAEMRRKRQRARTQRSFPWFGLLVAAVLAVGVFAGGNALGWFSAPSGEAIDPNVDRPSAAPGQQFADQGNTHIPDGQGYTGYNSTPPTSGPHWGSPVPWATFDSPQPDERLVHNLEHGGIVISYNGISATDVQSLKDLKSRYPRDQFGSVKIIIRPYDKIPAGTIALTAWRWMDSMTGYDEARVRRFLAYHMNRCCEAVR
jgi:hypothetical protein